MLSRIIIRNSCNQVRIYMLITAIYKIGIEKDSEISKNNALSIKNLLEISNGKRV